MITTRLSVLLFFFFLLMVRFVSSLYLMIRSVIRMAIYKPSEKQTASIWKLIHTQKKKLEKNKNRSIKRRHRDKKKGDAKTKKRKQLRKSNVTPENETVHEKRNTGGRKRRSESQVWKSFKAKVEGRVTSEQRSSVVKGQTCLQKWHQCTQTHTNKGCPLRGFLSIEHEGCFCRARAIRR